jgi:hypothetical protein
VALDGLPKADIRARHEPLAGKILAAVAIAMPAANRSEKIAAATVFFAADGKPIYGFNLQMGGAAVIVSRQTSSEELAAIRGAASKVAADASLERIVRLLNQSMEPEQDPLRRFLSAFMATEVFVNKNFRDYQTRFWDSLAASVSTPVRDRYLGRIHDVMRDKYKLLDKFVLISAELDPSDADTDIALFETAKELRDHFSHGEAIEENALPVSDIQALLRKFLRLHLNRN